MPALSIAQRMDRPTETATEQLEAAARDAARWFSNHVKGNALNGQHDDVLIARALGDAVHRLDQERGR